MTGGKLDAADPDAGDAGFVAQTGTAGAHGSFSIDASGQWTYTLDNADPAVQALGGGQTLPDEVFSVASLDGTVASVTVSINGTNDAPVAQADRADAVEAGGIGNATPGLDASGNRYWKLPDAKTLYIGSDAKFQIHRLSLTPILDDPSGTAKP